MDQPPAQHSRRRWLPRWVRWGGMVLVTALLLEYFVVPQLSGARAALQLLSQVTPGFLVIGVVLEAFSLVSYSGLTRSVLPATGRPSFWTILRIDLTGLGVSHVVPGAGATSSAMRYRLFTVAGMQPAGVLSATAIQGVGTGLVLAGVFAAGVLLALPSARDNPSFLLAGSFTAVLLLASALGVLMLTRRRAATLAWVQTATHIVPGLNSSAAVHFVQTLADQLGILTSDRRVMTRIIGWASGNWIFDAASLWIFLRAFGQTEGLEGLVLGYGLAGVLALLPLTPGGLGLVEGTLVSVLVGFGTPHANAVLGVITWRLAEFWLPIPLSALTYLSLRAGVLRPHRLPARPLVPRPDAAPDVDAALPTPGGTFGSSG